jgi:RNA polymerase sigma factor (sigma-70 family)
MAMRESEWLVERFEERRGRLRAVAYGMLGSLSEADDALQEVWLRLRRCDAGRIEHLDAWLTTVVGRVCLSMLRTRERRRAEPFGAHIPDPIVSRAVGTEPEHELLLADSVALALLVVIETLTPSERLAFVLHDLFAVPFEEIATVLGGTAPAARQLASRARRRVRGQTRVPDADLAQQEEVVDAFFAAAREGDFDRLVALLHPNVVARSDAGPARSRMLRGARTVARRAMAGARSGGTVRPAHVNGAPGAILLDCGTPVAIMAFTVAAGRIVEIDAIADAERVRRLTAGIDGLLEFEELATEDHERGHST